MQPILSDEEIDDIAAQYSDEFGQIPPDMWVPFAIAILTAQRKKEGRE